MRVLNPANLSDMSTSFEDYPLLGLQSVHNVRKDWNRYTRTEKGDIESPQGLVEWWETRQTSTFKHAVLFLILLPTLSGALERFFSTAGTVTHASHALSDNLCRVCSIAVNEERLVLEFWCLPLPVRGLHMGPLPKPLALTAYMALRHIHIPSGRCCCMP